VFNAWYLLCYVNKDIYNLTPAKVQDREILPEGVEDFPVLHFLPVFDFISYFYQLFLVSCLFDSYVLLADDHVNNVTYFPFMSIKKVFLCIA
jgi:hypothetical protein